MQNKRTALTFAAIVALCVIAPAHAGTAPPCSIEGGPGRDYVARLKKDAKAAKDRGRHAQAATLFASAADYAYRCTPQSLMEVIDGESSPHEIADTKRAFWGNAGAMFDEAAEQARAAGEPGRACSFSRRALDAYAKVPAYAHDMSSRRAKVKRSGC